LEIRSMNESNVDYGQVRQIGVIGVLVGAMIALGVTIVVLVWGPAA
jgi:hypothetical protein